MGFGGESSASQPGFAEGQPAAIPSYEQLLRPILEVVADGRTWGAPNLVEAVADLAGVDEASQQLRHPSGQTILANRIGWAKTSLVKAGLIEQPAPSSIVITEAGRAVLNTVDGPLDREFLRDNCSGFATWLADMGQLPAEELDSSAGSMIWMLRAGRAGVYAPVFVERSMAIVGWGQTGDVSEMSRGELETAVAECFPDANRNQRGQVINTLYRVAHTIGVGDLVITPEPGTRTLLLGHVAGQAPTATSRSRSAPSTSTPARCGGFARVSRDELSYGARNSLGSLLTLTRPSYATELLQLADAHAGDPPPAPIVARAGRTTEPAVPRRVPVPANAPVPKPELTSARRRCSTPMSALRTEQSCSWKRGS